MPLQNRCDPWGNLVATAARGTMMGNRGGRFHRDDQTLGQRRWATRHWICCDMYYKNKSHEAMGPYYTSVFFLDEVTALSAGHRPCFYCRNQSARAFLGLRRVDDFDRIVHAERLGDKPEIDVGDLPDGAMIEIKGQALGVLGDRLWQWSFDGYVTSWPRTSHLKAKLLTPPSITAILANGYRPNWHGSALSISI